jgi:hypothetical protein
LFRQGEALLRGGYIQSEDDRITHRRE